MQEPTISLPYVSERTIVDGLVAVFLDPATSKLEVMFADIHEGQQTCAIPEQEHLVLKGVYKCIYAPLSPKDEEEIAA